MSILSLLKSSSLLFKNRSNNIRCISNFLNRIASNDRTNNIAATFPSNGSSSDSITYGELNVLSSQISHYIKTKHNGVNIIGSYHHGESGYILSMIAAWKTNLTFVPLSTSHPEQELKYFVEDSSMGILLHSLGY
jgi:acyl-coenzyme A synthetase/AMP-(fatty) acid ligase